MKIAFLYDAPYPWHVGGIETIVNNEAKGLAKNNEVHLFSLQWPEMKKEFKYQNVAYHTFHKVTREKFYRHGRRSIREAIMFSFGLFRVFRYKFDVMVVNYFPILHLPLIKFYCRLNKCKLIMEVAEVWDKDYWINYLGPVLGRIAYFISKQTITGADIYEVLSSKGKNELVQCGIDKSKVRVFAPVIDNETINKINKKQNAKARNRIVFSGRLIRDKRLDKWLKIVKSVSDKDRSTEALIVGKGPESNEIKETIRKFKLENVVKIRGFYPSKEDFYKELKESKVLLHMSEREGLGITVIESVALGTPAVIPSNSPVPKEAREMCVVRKEEEIPRTILEIFKSANKKTYIKHTENIDIFSTSKIEEFYSKIFDVLGVK